MTTPTPSDKIVDDLVWCGRQLYHYEQPIMVPLSPEGFAAFDRARRMIHDYRRDLAAALEWKEVLLNELIIDHIYTKEHETNPRKAIHDAITWNCQVALDPAVSSDAQKLRDTHLQRAEAAERKAEEAARAIDLARRAMSGEGVEDQGQAWDKCLRILDAAIAAKGDA